MKRFRQAFMGGALYFAVVFPIAFLMGTVRSLVLEPVMGKPFAVAIEAPFLLTAMVWAAAWTPRRVELQGDRTGLLSMGAFAVLLQQIVYALLGFELRGLSLEQQYAQFQRPEGLLFALLLIVFAVAPLALHGRAE